jgi:hypothetical protein
MKERFNNPGFLNLGLQWADPVTPAAILCDELWMRFSQHENFPISYLE